MINRSAGTPAVASPCPAAAADWAGQARKAFLGRRNRRQAALCELLGLRASFDGLAADPPVACHLPQAGFTTLAARLRRLAAELQRLHLPEDARVAALLAVRCRLRRPTPTKQSSTAVQRLLRAYGRPGRFDRLDTRLLWRLVREERFRQNLEAEKDQSQLLDRKFQEGLKRAKDSPDPPRRPFDYD